MNVRCVWLITIKGCAWFNIL